MLERIGRLRIANVDVAQHTYDDIGTTQGIQRLGKSRGIQIGRTGQQGCLLKECSSVHRSKFNS